MDMMMHFPGQAVAVGEAAPSSLAPKGRSWMSIFKRLRDDLGFMHNPLLSPRRRWGCKWATSSLSSSLVGAEVPAAV